MAGVVRSDWNSDLRDILPDFFGPPSGPDGAASAKPVCVPECGEGWAAVVDRCCVRICAALRFGESFRFESIRVSQGALRIRWGGKLSAASEAAIRAAVDLAEARSVCVCETCGARGRLYRADGVLAARCADHAEGVPAVRPEMENVHLTQVTVRGRLRVVVAARYDYDTDSFVRIDDAATPERREA
ncbi:hypothetical protein [Bradyrhizobium japonicum]|uniref:hypothetical protein n=1 Tax=Bradyrhizobium japonicum TaxID=375 RepID=UPI00209D3B51|nr:hypothetical protein [Bradyrhizobium japonicum]MCP1760961.1 hypothetical protein [Bradyrhizobium japonicum]MCP1792540.1 hypothetical protein [Bradyrhizobium japonicum]MCP1804975.1 hypothetical protein [Bradyrhizobium japonicum]MCP1813996.1 hypothetical protein [Bradyrhizobium japonicum]MCP1874581.1 hypothetical protein [Bradyrhizobium japonicum]